MNPPDKNPLHKAAGLLEQGCGAARSWVKEVARTASGVASEESSLIHQTRRAQNVSRKLLGAATRTPCVGVFGPSQAGKSYLVSVLARPKDGHSLEADFGGIKKDFITEINPPGDRESTGLVTRFTVRREPVNASHPVEVRLLSETDLVKILGNTFFSDFDPNLRSENVQPPTEETIRTTVTALRQQASQRQAHLDEIAMFDIGEYFDQYFKAWTAPYGNAGYWAALTEFGHLLGYEQRIEMYSLLWGKVPELTVMFRILLSGLESLGHAPQAHASLDALAPRERCIIDVQMLYNLGTPADDMDAISVVPAGGLRNGQAIKLTRAVLTALVAEIKIVMTSAPWNFFNHTDLLDFPGARSREKMLDLPADPAERDMQVRQMLLRGKIAYLFQRFTDERELTSMLLCMPDSNMEVKDLPAMVKEWVEMAHGRTAQERAEIKCTLFLVLTKFDRTFEEKSGDNKDSRKTKLDRRLDASFLKPFGSDDWVKDWDGRPFSNSVFLRNPGVKQTHIMQYARIEQRDDGSEFLDEAGIAPDAAERLEEYRASFENSALCKPHFKNPRAAWEAAFKPNDGGIEYLVGQLENVLEPRLKEKQLVERLLKQASQVEIQLKRFYHSDSAQSRKEKEESLNLLRRKLHNATKGDQFASFIKMLSECMVYERDVREVFLNVASLNLDALPVTPEGESADLDDPWADEPATPKAKVQTVPPLNTDRFVLFANEVLNLWTSKVREIGTDPQIAARLGIGAELLTEVANELVVGAHRHGLKDTIANTVRDQMQAAQLVWEKAADRASGIAVHLIDDYVTYLGFARLLEKDRPAMKGRPVFKIEMLPDGVPVLEPQRVKLESQFFMDWGTGFLELGLDNVSFATGREISEEDNARLGEIIETLQIQPLLGAAA